MYILLSGCPPFAGSSDARILQRVQQGSYSFAAKEVSRQEIWCSTCLVMPLSRHRLTSTAVAQKLSNLVQLAGWLCAADRICESLCAGISLCTR